GPGRADLAVAGGADVREPGALGGGPQLHEPVALDGVAVAALLVQLDGLGDGASAARRGSPTESDAFVHERGHRDAPPVTDVAEPLGVGDADVGEVHLVELRLACHLAEGTYVDARGVHVDDEV